VRRSRLAAKMNVLCLIRRGADPNDAMFGELSKIAAFADAQITQAADAVNGLFDLPLTSDTTASGVAKGGPRWYSETSPYVWQALQREVGVGEDEIAEGTSGSV
jgi:hypothetical protein